MPFRRIPLVALCLAAGMHECLADGHGEYAVSITETALRHDRSLTPNPLPQGEGDAVSLREFHVHEGDPPGEPLQLRLSGQITTSAPFNLPYPVFFEADLIQGVRGRELSAEGDVRMRRLTEQVSAERMHFDQVKDEVEAHGKVIFMRDRNRVEGSELRLQLSQRLGGMKDARYQFFDLQGGMAQGGAEVIRFEGPDSYRLKEATYSTCPADAEDWVLKTEDLKLDYAANLGTARHVQLRYLGTPILYTPWMDFSLDERRKTGMLSPTVGASAERGVELLMPWYWNIAVNRDATFYPRIMTNRGLQLGAEFRYLESAYGGEAAVEYLPSDQQANRDRLRGYLHHTQEFGKRWSGRLLYEQVSDDSYFTDLSSLVNETSRVNLPQEGTLHYAADWWSATARLQRYQTLQDPAAPVLAPYERMPQLLLDGTRQSAGNIPLRFRLSSEFVHFVHGDPTQADGDRLDFYPRLSLPLTSSYGFLTPKIGWRYSRYELDRNPLGGLNYSRSLPILSLDSGVYLEREWSAFGREFLQTLEPRAYYVRIPYQDQTGIPVFDTALRDLSLDQLFSENQYSGVDRVNDANQLTLAVTSRLLVPDSGVERLQVTVGQRFYFDDQRVVLPGQPVRQSSSSDVLLQTTGQVTDRLRLTSGVEYNTDQSNLVNGNFGLAYRDGPGRVLNAQYRYIDGSINQFDLSAQWPLKNRWYGLGRVNYSTRESRLVEGLLGLEYKAGCWTLRGVAHRLATTALDSSDAFFLQLELAGLTALGPNPLQVLKRSIFGYTKSDESNF